MNFYTRTLRLLLALAFAGALGATPVVAHHGYSGSDTTPWYLPPGTH
jgi:hypothetical protein